MTDTSLLTSWGNYLPKDISRYSCSRIPSLRISPSKIIFRRLRRWQSTLNAQIQLAHQRNQETRLNPARLIMHLLRNPRSPTNLSSVHQPSQDTRVVDAVVRHWKHVHSPVDFEELALFYADDGMITGIDQARVRASLDIITSSFATVGLKMNACKTEFMVMTGGRHQLRMRTAAYTRRMTGEGTTYDEQRKEKVQCLKCGALVGRPSLKRHQESGKCKSASKTYQPRHQFVSE